MVQSRERGERSPLACMQLATSGGGKNGEKKSVGDVHHGAQRYRTQRYTERGEGQLIQAVL